MGYLQKHIVFVGLMGSGKTALARMLTKDIDAEAIDSDQVIEQVEGLYIPTIFSEKGEPYFRARETQVIHMLLEKPPALLSLGGGAFMEQSTREACLQKAYVIWLNAPINLLLERVGNGRTRPLLQQGNHSEILEQLLSKREPFYQQAHTTIDASLPLPEMSRLVLKQLYDNHLLSA
jgi:shikimate kinase